MSAIATTGSTSGASGTTYVSGASGFDSTALIAAAVEAKMQPAYRLDLQIAALEAETAAYEEMLTLMADISAAAESLSGFGDDSAYGTYAAYLTAPGLGDPQTYLNATVSEGAGAGLYQIAVTQLAQGMKVAADERDPATALGLAGSFSLSAEGGRAVEIAVTADMTLADVAAAINAASEESGVVATLIRTGDGGSTLTLSTAETGVSLTAAPVSGDDLLQALGIADASGAFANELQAAQAAVLTIDGVTVTSASNDIEDLIPGVSVNLYGATEGESIALEVGQDLSAVSTAIEAFVEAFNAYRSFALTQQAVVDGEGASDDAALFGDSLLKSANRALYDVMETGVSLGGVDYALADIGIAYGAGNLLTVDRDALEDALLQRPEVVEAVFASRAATGSPDLGVTALGAGMANGNYGVALVTDAATGEILSASIDGIALEVEGASLRGAEGTAFEGLTLVYTGQDGGSFTLAVSQGLADRTVAALETYSDGNDGLVTAKVESLESGIDDKRQNRADIAVAVAAYEASLVAYYARLEREIAQSELLLQQVEALLGTDDD